MPFADDPGNAWMSVVALVLSTTVGPLVGLWINKRSDDRAAKTQRELDGCHERMTGMEKDIAECNRDRVDLRNKLAAVEATLVRDAPMWRRSAQGVVLAVSGEFVRLFCAPFGYAASDVVGRKFSDLTAFAPKLLAVLSGMDREVYRRGYAVRHPVEITPGSTAAVFKYATHTAAGELVFVSYAIPLEATTAPAVAGEQ